MSGWLPELWYRWDIHAVPDKTEKYDECHNHELERVEWK